MGLRPMARMETGNCSGSGEVGSAPAALTRIFDITWNYTSGLRDKRARACGQSRCGFAASPVDSPQVVVDKLGCQRNAGLAKQALSRGLIHHWGKSMLRAAKVVVLSILALAIWGLQPAAAGCDVISATHSADTKSEALAMSRA